MKKPPDHFSVAIVDEDESLCRNSGVEWQRQLVASGGKTPVIFPTAYDGPEWRDAHSSPKRYKKRNY